MANDSFGCAVAINDNALVVGADQANSAQGKVYLFGTGAVPANVSGVSTTAAANSQYAVGGTVSVSVAFSQAVNVTGNPQLLLDNGGVATYASGSGTAALNFTYVVAAGQSTAALDYVSTAALTLNGASIQDLAGNAAMLTLPATGTDSLATKDLVVKTPQAPIAVSTTAAANSRYKAGGTVAITITFSAAVNVTGTPQLTLNDGAVVNYSSGSGTATLTFTYTVVAGQNTAALNYASTTALALNGGTIKDLAGNAAVLTLPATGTDGLAAKRIVIDTTPPTVSAVSTTAAANSRYKAGGTVSVTVAFSEPVNVSGTPQLTLNDGAVVYYDSGSGTATLTFTYTVAAGEDTADLDYASTAALGNGGGGIRDLAGNAAVLTLPATGTDGLATQEIVIDTTAPTVSAVSTTAAANSKYMVGGTVTITVAFSEPVNVSGTPQLTLNDGAVVNYSSGSGTATLTFTYTVVAGQNTAALNYASTTALALNGGTIKDLAGNAAVLTLPATGTDGLATQEIVIDTTAPTVSAVSTTAAANSKYMVGGTVTITVAFSEPVNVSGTPQLTLNDGAVVNYSSGSGTATLTFTYTVVAGQNTAALNYASTTALALNGGTIKDLAGNAAVLTLPATGTDGLATRNIEINTTLNVPPAVWTLEGLTLTLDNDGNLNVYTTGTTTDAVPPVAPASVGNIEIISPSDTTASLTIDSTNGNPIPAGGMNYSGGGGLIKVGSGRVTLSGTNTYMGGTIVAAGTLLINVVGALPTGTSLTIGAGGTFIFDPSQAASSLSTTGFAAATSGSSGHPHPLRQLFQPARSRITSGRVLTFGTCSI